MANVRVCDICGEICKASGRYELIYRCFLRNEKEDICLNCIKKIKEFVQKSKIKLSMTTDKIKLINIINLTTKEEVNTKYNDTKVNYSRSKINVGQKLSITDTNGIIYIDEYVVDIQENYYGFEVVTINNLISFRYCDNNWEEIKQ